MMLDKTVTQTGKTSRSLSRPAVVVKAIALLSCLWVGFWAYHFAIASLYILASERQIELWNKTPQNVTLENVDKVTGWLERAIEHDPRHPHYYNLLGKSHQWQAYVQYTEQKNAPMTIAFSEQESPQRALQLAKQAYLKGAQLRPEWPVTWSDLAQIEHQLHGADLNLYLRNADHFGPYMAEVNLTLASIGLERWNQLDKELRMITMRHIDRALRHPQVAQRFARYAQSLDKLNLACVLASRAPDALQTPIRVCRKAAL